MNRLAPIVITFSLFAGSSWAADGRWPQNVQFSAVPGGKFSNWDKPLPCPTGSLSLYLQMAKLQTNPIWEASSAIVFFSEGKEEFGSYHVTTLNRQASALYRADTHFKNGKTIFNHPLYGPIALGKRMEVNLTWTEAHNITAAIDGVPMEAITLQAPITTIRFLASGSQAIFSDILLECGLTS